MWANVEGPAEGPSQWRIGPSLPRRRVSMFSPIFLTLLYAVLATFGSLAPPNTTAEYDVALKPVVEAALSNPEDGSDDRPDQGILIDPDG